MPIVDVVMKVILDIRFLIKEIDTIYILGMLVMPSQPIIVSFFNKQKETIYICFSDQGTLSWYSEAQFENLGLVLTSLDSLLHFMGNSYLREPQSV